MTNESGATADDIWEGDLLERREVAERFTHLIESNTKRQTISIEAGFGMGKSWFEERWARHLSSRGHTVVRVNAWEKDYLNDPLAAFAEAIDSHLPKSKELKSNFKKVATALGKVVLAGGIRAGTAGVLNLGDVHEVLKAATQGTAEALEEQANNYLKVVTAEQKLRDMLKETIEALVSALESNKKLIFLVDELDRCEPTYALRMLEHVKHLFDQDRVVFVFFVDMRHLSGISRHSFGPDAGGEPYLKKFFGTQLLLPNPDFCGFGKFLLTGSERFGPSIEKHAFLCEVAIVAMGHIARHFGKKAWIGPFPSDFRKRLWEYGFRYWIL